VICARDEFDSVRVEERVRRRCDAVSA